MPQGSLHQQQSRGNSTVRIAIFAAVALHAVFFAGPLMQGCRPDSDNTGGEGLSSNSETNAPNELAGLETNFYGSFDDLPPVTTDFSDTNGLPAPGLAEPAPEEVEPSVPITEVPQPDVPEETPPAETTEYVVVRGDNLHKIAAAHGVTLNAIVRENPNIDPSLIRPGQKIVIPPPKLDSSGGVSSGGAQDSSNIYVVKAGDTLTKIAKHLGTTIAAIKSANNLRTDRILIGKKLIIPESASASNAGTENN